MYKLYSSGQGEEKELIEEIADGDHFIFVSALGMTLDAFEAQIAPLKVRENVVVGQLATTNVRKSHKSHLPCLIIL